MARQSLRAGAADECPCSGTRCFGEEIAPSENRGLTKPRFRSKITVYIKAKRGWGHGPRRSGKENGAFGASAGRRGWCATTPERLRTKRIALFKECRFALR